ncbi:hypothetical protein [Azospirillum sp. TSO35-2]|uniref:hypothetical protein n=1 Tax=Azospirillum sp. TSO35-2 TaxID=716796 RepID=UPI000D621C98|nr:hypothetical protein [Azospirillum sp. TSO35-2]PWC35849.1 hypothetical protein TSO352_11495 [Azospirillum sp. TSO35-2]
MHDPEPQAPPETPSQAPTQPPIPDPVRHRCWWTLGLGLGLLGPLALGGLGVLALLWTGSRLYDQPFVWYNLNRINAAAERAARDPDPVTVVALGDTALRDATLDEREMATLAAKRGVANLHFLRIVHRQAQFADFEPLLDRLIAVKPALILIDRDLLTARRGALEDLARYSRALLRLYDGRPYVQDQVALQYRRSCGPTPAAWLTGGTSDAVTGSGATAERVRAFIDRAWSAGIRVALIEVRTRPAKPPSGGVIAAAEAAEPDAPGANLPQWRYASPTDDDDDTSGTGSCADGRSSADGRAAFSTWLAGGIAGAVASADPDRGSGRRADRAPAVSATASLP